MITEIVPLGLHCPE